MTRLNSSTRQSLPLSAWSSKTEDACRLHLPKTISCRNSEFLATLSLLYFPRRGPKRIPPWRDLDVRRYFFEILAITLIAGSMFFFYECILFLSRRDYVGAIILTLIGLTVIRAGSEMARLTILEKR